MCSKRPLVKEMEARTGIVRDESVHIRGGDVGSIVEEIARQEDMGMWTTVGTWTAVGTMGIVRDLSVHVPGGDVDQFVKETEREAQVGMWRESAPSQGKEASEGRNPSNKVLQTEMILKRRIRRKVEKRNYGVYDVCTMCCRACAIDYRPADSTVG